MLEWVIPPGVMADGGCAVVLSRSLVMIPVGVVQGPKGRVPIEDGRTVAGGKVGRRWRAGVFAAWGGRAAGKLLARPGSRFLESHRLGRLVMWAGSGGCSESAGLRELDARGRRVRRGTCWW